MHHTACSHRWCIKADHTLCTSSLASPPCPTVLTRVAINRYILDGTLVTDASQAVHALCSHLHSTLVPQAMASADDFRRQFCYIEGVSLVLHAQRRNLRTLFDVRSHLGHTQSDSSSGYHARLLLSRVILSRVTFLAPTLRLASAFPTALCLLRVPHRSMRTFQISSHQMQS